MAASVVGFHSPITIGVGSDEVVVPVLFLLIFVGVAWHLYSTRAMRQELSFARRQELGSKERQVMDDREQKMFDQHSMLNGLTAEKLRLENQMLAIQIKLGERELEHREDGEDFRDLMKEKAQLEIQSLRLQIREQKKRLDEFGTFEDE